MADELIYYGGAVKALGNGKVGGYLVRFGAPDDVDADGEFFTAETDFDMEDGKQASVYYHHGLDAKIGKRRLGKAMLKKNEAGIWAEAQLQLRDEYEQEIYKMVEAGKLGWSSGTADHLVEREPVGKATWLKMWPLGSDASLTPTPAEFRNAALPIKSLIDIASNLTQDTVQADVAETASAQGVSDDDKRRLQLRANAYLKSTEQ